MDLARAAANVAIAPGTSAAKLPSVASRWTARVHRHGRAIVIAAMAWGVAIVALGLVNALVPALVALCIAGAADMISGLFRQTVWNQTVPDALRGRLPELWRYDSEAEPLVPATAHSQVT